MTGKKISAEEMREHRESVLNYIRDHGPAPRRTIIEATGLDKQTTISVLRWLKLFGHITPTCVRTNAEWEFVRGLSRKPAPSVQVVRNDRWLAPATIKTILPGGVPYSYTPAPRGRYECDVMPGTGAISAMNPRLASLSAERK